MCRGLVKLGDAEVEHFHAAVRADHDVGRLQITMRDALAVGGAERTGQRHGDLEHPAERHAPQRNHFRERLAGHQFHRQERQAGGLFDRVDRDDVRVVESGHSQRFLLEAVAAFVIVDLQRLDRDVAVESRVAGAVDIAHPARADLRDDFVRAEARAGDEGQFVGIIRARRTRGSDSS